MRIAAATLMIAANPYAAPMFACRTIAAAAKGPMKMPIRNAPPRVDSALARIRSGIASVR